MLGLYIDRNTHKNCIVYIELSCLDIDIDYCRRRWFLQAKSNARSAVHLYIIRLEFARVWYLRCMCRGSNIYNKWCFVYMEVNGEGVVLHTIDKKGIVSLDLQTLSE